MSAVRAMNMQSLMNLFCFLEMCEFYALQIRSVHILCEFYVQAVHRMKSAVSLKHALNMLWRESANFTAAMSSADIYDQFPLSQFECTPVP